MTDLVLATDAGRADGAAALAAAVGVAIALGLDAEAPGGAGPGSNPRVARRPAARSGNRDDSSPRVLVVEHGAREPPRPTMLASRGARILEEELRASGGLLAAAAARGRVCFLALPGDPGGLAALAAAVGVVGSGGALTAHIPARLWSTALDRRDLPTRAALLRAELPADRPLAALAVAELHERGLRVRIATRALGTVASRRARAGLDPGGPASSRIERLARGLLGRRCGAELGAAREPPRATPAPGSARNARLALRGDSGQVLPAVLLAAVLVVGAALGLTAILGALTGKGRAQRSADLIALSAARSMRDDFPRLFAPPRTPQGTPNPAHLGKAAYLERAAAAALEAAQKNAVAVDRVQVDFPDAASFAPTRARVRLVAELAGPRPPSRRRSGHRSDRRRPAARGVDVVATAVAEAAPAAGSEPAQPPDSEGGGYGGPLAYRQGKPTA